MHSSLLSGLSGCHNPSLSPPPFTTPPPPRPTPPYPKRGPEAGQLPWKPTAGAEARCQRLAGGEDRPSLGEGGQHGVTFPPPAGPSLSCFHWPRGVQACARLQQLLEWMRSTGCGEAGEHFFRKLSCTLNLLATPRAQLIQVGGAHEVSLLGSPAHRPGVGHGCGFGASETLQCCFRSASGPTCRQDEAPGGLCPQSPTPHGTGDLHGPRDGEITLSGGPGLTTPVLKRADRWVRLSTGGGPRPPGCL